MFGKQLGEHMGTLGLYHHIPPGAIKGRCASMAPLIRPIMPTLSICAALLGVGLTIATNAEQAFPCTTRHPRSRPTRGQILQSPYHQHGLRAPPPAGHPMTGGDEGPGVDR